MELAADCDKRIGDTQTTVVIIGKPRIESISKRLVATSPIDTVPD